MPRNDSSHGDSTTSLRHALYVLTSLVSQPIWEIIYGIRFRTLPWAGCLCAGVLFNFTIQMGLDVYCFKVFHLKTFYPQNYSSFLTYWSFLSTSGFWIWGLFQVWLKRRLILKLTTAFAVAGLKTPLGKFPSFIFDRPIDQMTRRLRLKRQYLSLAQFKDAKDSLESSLQVYIDMFVEHREKGSVDILYSHFPMDELVELGSHLRNLPKDTFIVGKSRSQFIRVNLGKTPHFLVGGQTGGGKSTFLRQMITSLYLNNRDYQFCLIDLKGGLEFQIFEKLPRIKVMPDSLKAIALIRTLERSLKYRMETLKLNGCKDIESYFRKPVSERSKPEGSYHERISRTIVVIDEVADLFMAGGEAKMKDVQEAKRIVWKIGAQGRAVGLHLVVATQRPDVKALDSQIKTHLVGVVCFPMVNDASSMTVLGNGRATDLPRIPGRAIWKWDLDMLEIQTPFLKPEEVLAVIKPTAEDPEIQKEAYNETPIQECRNSDSNVPLEMEDGNNIDYRDEVLPNVQVSQCPPKVISASKEWIHPNFD